MNDAYSKQPRVLVADDEPTNVEPFMHFLSCCKIRHSYAPSLPEAACMIHSRAEHKKRPYGAIVLDNHFQQHSLSSYDPNFNGIDLALVLLGRTSLFTPGHHRFAKDFFGEHYQKIVETYRGKIVLFSGSAFSDKILRPDLFEGLLLAEKRPDRFEKCSEDPLVDALEELGYDFDNCRSLIRRYKERHNLLEGVLQEEEDDPSPRHRHASRRGPLRGDY